MQNILNIIGLTLNIIGSLLLLSPLINTKKYVDDDYIVSMNKNTGEYTQKKHLNERKLGLWGFALLALGFIFQLIPILTSYID